MLKSLCSYIIAWFPSQRKHIHTSFRFYSNGGKLKSRAATCHQYLLFANDQPYTRMDQDEYVETSDVEELADVYALRRWRDFEDVIKGRQLTPVHSQTVHPSPKTETLQKRRKVVYTLLAESPADIWLAQPWNYRRDPSICVLFAGEISSSKWDSKPAFHISIQNTRQGRPWYWCCFRGCRSEDTRWSRFWFTATDPCSKDLSYGCHGTCKSLDLLKLASKGSGITRQITVFSGLEAFTVVSRW